MFTRDAELLIRTPIKELAEQLDPEHFRQVHRGTLVNLRQVISARHDALGRVAGPHDSSGFFGRFLEAMRAHRLAHARA